MSTEARTQRTPPATTARPSPRGRAEKPYLCSDEVRAARLADHFRCGATAEELGRDGLEGASDHVGGTG